MSAVANTNIYYKCGDAFTGLWSKEYKLHLPPLPGTSPPSRPTTVILYQDLGYSSKDPSLTWGQSSRAPVFTAEAVGAEVASGSVDAVFHGGDISYANGNIAVWDFFMDMISPVTSGVLYLTSVGNHESDYPGATYWSNIDSGGECGVISNALLSMPEPASTNNPWWGYSVGLIHFVGMSTEHDFTTNSPQNLWLDQELSRINRTLTPW